MIMCTRRVMCLAGQSNSCRGFQLSLMDDVRVCGCIAQMTEVWMSGFSAFVFKQRMDVRTICEWILNHCRTSYSNEAPLHMKYCRLSIRMQSAQEQLIALLSNNAGPHRQQ